jgi:phospholipid/cholesterol/gamma-HCH transport system ATP-binding protein
MSSGQEKIISVKGLCVSYDETAVLEDVSFEVYKGGVFVILGGSGCGKSTLLKHMIGLYKPRAGEILIEGVDIVTARGEDRLELLGKFGVMYQNGALFGSMTVIENLKLVLEELTDVPAEMMDLVCMSKLRLVGLDGAAYKMPDELSGGMKKRAAIARAMVLDPDILFLDEPSAGLDPVTSAQLDDLIVSLSRRFGMTFVVVTHELASIDAIADRVVMLDKETKNIIATGTPADLRKNSSNPTVQQFFNRDKTIEKIFERE